MEDFKGTGFLSVQTTAGEEALPIEGAHIVISDGRGTVFYESDTDASGITPKYPLRCPPAPLTLDSSFTAPAYSTYDVEVSCPGFVTQHIHDVEIVDTSSSYLPVNMLPLEDGMQNSYTENPMDDVFGSRDEKNGRGNNGGFYGFPDVGSDYGSYNQAAAPHTLQNNIAPVEHIYIPPVGLLVEGPQLQVTGPTRASRVFREVFIPDYITVHLGVPTDTSARNVRVKFSDYVKNVASSEIYPTWPPNSLLANIHAITTFALNRVYTEWYPSRNHNFDITNSTSYDQYFVYGRNIFENISELVDTVFNTYARRFGFNNPYFTEFCSGTTVTCRGMSQWGTVSLANQGYTPLQILRYYYPDDIELIATNNIQGITASYPGYPLRLNSAGDNVRRMQNYLNRIRINYPLIPQITNPNGTFGPDTDAAVRAFQRAFSMAQDGVIGPATWNKICFIYVAVTKLAELSGEGERIGIGKTPPVSILKQGSRGHDVLELQFILNFIAEFHPELPFVIKDSYFDSKTANAVITFQKAFNLNPDGIVGPQTWNRLYAVYNGIIDNAPIPPSDIVIPETPNYPGTLLKQGSTGSSVRLMQTFLNVIRAVYPSIPVLVVDGIFGPNTKAAVIAFQQQFMLAPDGIIGPLTWSKIVEQYNIVLGRA